MIFPTATFTIFFLTLIVGEPMVPPRAPSFTAPLPEPLRASRRAKPGSGDNSQPHDSQ